MDSFGELFNMFENLVNSNNSLFNNMSVIKSLLNNTKINESALNESLTKTGFYDNFSSNLPKMVEEIVKDITSLNKYDSKTQLNINNSTISKNNIVKNNTNYTNNIINQTKPLLTEPIHKTNFNTNYIFYLKIIIPIIVVILLIIMICYCIKKRIKSKIKANNDNLSQNNQMNNSGDSGVKQHYDRILNTSGNANNIGATPNNLSEIKVQNMKKEIDEILNTSGSSSGRRKRGKKNPEKNNEGGFDVKEGQMQNEIKEQVKQYVIDEHNNI